MVSDVPDRFDVPASEPGPGSGVELTVPRYSQEIHKGQYPEYDNGGEAWCSPTSSQMIIEYWGRKPTAEDLAWVNPDFADPQVCHAARFTFDYQYDGCGNWPFNAAYAATYKDMESVVTRLGSPHRRWRRSIAAGIPVITSQSFLESELDGAGYGTAGHLMTVIGFTEDGDIIANDPASPTTTTPYATSTSAGSGRTSGSAPSATTRTARSSPVRAASATSTSRRSSPHGSGGLCGPSESTRTDGRVR